YDLLSLDVGATPDISVPGVAEHAVPIKPISGFDTHWRAMLEAFAGEAGEAKGATAHAAGPPRRIAVVGGGAGSVEIVLAMAWALRDARLHTRKSPGDHATDRSG